MFYKKRSSKFILVLMLIFVALVCGCGKAEKEEEAEKPKKESGIDLSKYVVCEVTGYDGFGRATVSLDIDRMAVDYEKKLKFNSKGAKRYGESSMTPVRLIKDGATVTLEKETELSNNEKVKFKITLDDTITEYLRCKFTGLSSTYVVEGLDPVVECDPFDGVNVSFAGVSPFGKASVDRFDDKESVSYYDFSFENSDNLKNGDTVTLNYNVSGGVSDYAEKHGVHYTATSKQYTVSGLSEYILSEKDIPADFIEKSKADVEALIQKETANQYKDAAILSDLKYVGYVTDVGNSNERTVKENGFYLIYSGKLSDTTGTFVPRTCFYPVRVYKLISENGVITGETDQRITGNLRIDEGSRVYGNGYLNPYVCYKDLSNTISNRGAEFKAAGGFEAYSGDGNVKTLADIPSGLRDRMDSYAKKQLTSYVNREAQEKYKDPELFERVGDFYLFAKNPGGDFSLNSKYYVVYKVNLAYSHLVYAAEDVYFPIEFDGLYKVGSDDCGYTESKGIQGSYKNNGWGHSGYNDVATMYKEIIGKNEDNYTALMSDPVKNLFESIQTTEDVSAGDVSTGDASEGSSD